MRVAGSSILIEVVTRPPRRGRGRPTERVEGGEKGGKGGKKKAKRDRGRESESKREREKGEGNSEREREGKKR